MILDKGDTMRLIVEYEVLVDCGGDSVTTYNPAVYESKEKFLQDFEVKLSENLIDFKLGGTTFWSHQFKHRNKILLPQLHTLDEWFATCEK